PLVIKGSIKVMREGEDGAELLLYFLHTGDTCSVSFTCCMMDKQSSIKTIAEDDTTIIAIPIKQIDKWMNQYTSWRNFVMMSYDNRIMELVKTVDSIAFNKLDQRLFSYLQKKAKAHQSSVIHVTHQEISYDLNASREAISRLLKQLEKMGKVRLGRNMIELP
ncbi:MAG: Crp/Fnr family transcriptional regulator, partial [Bacteroidota bacterium]